MGPGGPLEFVDPVAQPEAALLRLLVAGLLGGLIGVERERDASETARTHFAGVRTFPLFALLGAGLVLASAEVGLAVVAGFTAVGGLVVASYVHTSRQGSVGATTETAALITYWVGVLAGAGALLVAGALGIGVAVLLAGKSRLEAFPRALSREELHAALTLAAIAAVILPILPDAGYGPWKVWNPRRLWAMVVIVCGLSFMAFVGMRLWGGRRGLYASGLLGGLVSSTAATVSFATRSRGQPGHAATLAAAAGLSSLVMLARVVILAALVGPATLPVLVPVLTAAAGGGMAAVAVVARRSRHEAASEPAVANPFNLAEAIRFAAFYGLVLLLVEAASRTLGTWGVIAAAALAGLTDVDAVTLALAGGAVTGLDPGTAAAAIALAVLSNTLAKAAYAAWLGTRPFARATAAILGAAFVAGGIALALLRRLA